MIAYVNEVVRNSEAPGSELTEAIERLRIDAGYWLHRERERAEHDERTLPIDQPRPAAPIAPAAPGVPLCHRLSGQGATVAANPCDCGGG